MSDDITDGTTGGDDLDQRLREHARLAKDAVVVGGAEVEQALAAVKAGGNARPGEGAGNADRRGVLWVASAAAVVALLVGIVAVRAGRSEDVSNEAPPVDTVATTVDSGPAPTVGTSVPSTSTATTAPPTSTTTTTTTTPSTMPPTTTTATTLPSVPAVTLDDLIERLADVPWESSGIGRLCVRASNVCTQVAIGPGGEPVTLDPEARTLVRHVREDGAYLSAPLPAQLDGRNVGLLAVGPDDVAYLFAFSGDEDADDVFAVSIAPGDAGRVLAEYPAAIPLGDVDVFPSPEGLVSSGWYAPGPRPSADAPVLVEWVDRDPDSGVPTGIEWAWFDDAGRTAGVDDREWSLDGRTVVPEQSGSSQVVATFDGGFIAVYSETTGDLRAEVIRGWPDGSVEYWQLPGSWLELGSPIPEPMGTVLLPVGDAFYRVAPFTDRTPDVGEMSIDYESGDVDVSELNAMLANDGPDPVEAFGGSEALSNAIAGPIASPAELRTIDWGAMDESGVMITVMTERHLDDSVYGTRFDVRLAGDLVVVGPVEMVSWSQACQPDRGQQDYQSELCV